MKPYAQECSAEPIGGAVGASNPQLTEIPLSFIARYLKEDLA